MLDLYGREYVITHAVAEINERAEARRYRAYITDALMVMTENTAKFVGGSYVKTRWLKDKELEDERTGDEVALEVIMRAGLKVKGGEINGD